MATTKTYVLTTGFDQIVTGQELILNGVDQGKHVPTGKHKTIILNANNPGSYNSGDDIEITNLATNNTLNASYLNFNTEVVATLLGVQLVNVKLGEHDVTFEGGNVATFGGGTAANYNGLANGTFTLLQSTGGEFFLGGGAPLEVLATNFVAQNATPEGSGLDVNLDAALFTSPVTVKAAFNGVGNPGTHQSDSDDYVHGGSNAFEFAYGSSDGTVTATTWSLTATGKNSIALFTHGSTTPTEVDVKGAGSMTLFGESFEFANVAKISDTATGAQIITGALQTDGSSRPDLGFLTDNVALTAGGSLTVSSTNSGNFVDLSGFESLGTATISVAAGTVVLSDDVLLSGSPIVIGTPTNIGYGGDEGDGPGHNGTINWANLPSSANTLTFYHGVEDFPANNSGDAFLNIVNTPNTFTMNLQDENFHHNDFFITAATPAAGNTFILDIGSNAGTIGVLGATGGTPNDIEDTWTVTGYSTVNIHLAGSNDVHLASSGGFVADSGGFGATTINISGSLVDGTDVQEMHFGNVSGVTIDEFFSIGSLISSPDEARGVTTFDGTINDTAKVFLELGATDAVIINAASGHGLDMEQPDTSADATITVTGSTNNFNNLQGSFALEDGTNGNDGWFGLAGKATITGGAVADHIWDTGGKETVNVNNIHTKVFVDQFQLNSDDDFAFAITSRFGDMDNNQGSGPKTVTINGFTPGASNSGWVDFNTDSWGTGYTGLVTGLGNPISGEGSHFASFSVIAGTGNSDLSDVVAYEIGGTYANAAAVAKAIVSTGGSFIDFVGTGHTFDLLVAYANTSGGTNIADIQLFQNNILTTAGADIENTADLVTLAGVGLGKIIGSVLGSNDVVHFNGA